MKTFVDAQIKHAPSNVKLRRASRAINPLVTCAVIAFVGFLASIACAVPSFAQIVGTVQLNIERRGHTATLLEDGKVLIVGGDNQNGIVNQVELLDPASQTSSLAAMPIVARTDHTATRLADGRVLIIGGRDQNGSLTSTEIYNPLTAKFTAGPSLTTPRSGHSATVLANDDILVAGGDASGSAELYNPTTQGFSLVAGSMNTARKFQSAILLNNGQVLIAGGVGAQNNVLNTAEVYDPSSQSFYVPPTDMQTPRALAMLKLLSDGKVQIIGGDADLSMEVFDPTNGIFIAKALLPPNADLLGATLSTQSRAALFSPTISQDPLLQGVMTPEQSALLDRADQSITELPSRNQALVAGGINSAGQILNSAKLVSSSMASVTTDKTDYAPGQIVTITGSGFQPNERVDIYFHEFPEEYPDIFLSAVANQQGNFVVAEFAPQQIDLDRIFTLTAVGQTSGFTAQTAFKDALSVTSVSPNSGPTTGGTSVTISVSGIGNGPWTVLFGGVSATSVAKVGGNLTAVTPAHVAGPVTVTVREGAGSPVTCTASPCFTYNAAAKATPVITFGTAPTPTFGGGNFTVSASTTNTDSSTLTYSHVSGPCAVVNANTGIFSSSGAGTCVVRASGAETTNFLAASADQSVTIAKAPVTATAGGGTTTYDGTTKSPSACLVTGVYKGDLTCANNPASVGPGFGTTTIEPVVSGTGLANFEVTNVNGSYTINKAPVTATAGGGTTTYDGTTKSPSACLVTGVYKGDLTCANNPASVGPGFGTTTIEPVVSGTGLANFEVTNVNGSYTINKAPVTATAGGGTTTYDGTTKSPSACLVTGVYKGDLTCANNPASVGPGFGTTTIEPVVSGTGLANFEVTNVNGSYTINPLGFDGFLSPIGGADDATGGDFAHPIRTVKLGSTLPVKFIAYGGGGTPWLTGVHTIQAFKYSSDTYSLGDPMVVSATDSATTGNQFRLTDGQWHFNMSTKSGFSQGTWKIVATLEDGSTHYAWIALKK